MGAYYPTPLKPKRVEIKDAEPRKNQKDLRQFRTIRTIRTIRRFPLAPQSGTAAISSRQNRRRPADG